MFSISWRTSERKYKVVVERNVRIRMPDGVELDANIFRPETQGKRFPAILGAHPYSKEGQYEPIKVYSTSGLTPHEGEERPRGSLEAGDPFFFARRGYVHVIANLRGTGKSGGLFSHLGKREVTDVYETLEWVSKQPWCDGKVGMFGVSYFAMIQLLVGALNPPHLKCLFAPWASTNPYRDMYYHGGILSYAWTLGYARTSLTYSDTRPLLCTLEELSQDEFDEQVASLLEDEDIAGNAQLVEVLKNPKTGLNPFIVDVLLHPLEDSYWKERSPLLEKITVPCYLGGDWASFHLSAAFRNWERIRSPKKLIIGPAAYLDRPLYQLQYESLRWFDLWLKEMDTGIMNEPPIRLFVGSTGTWKSVHTWPLSETKWTTFFIHENGLLSERDYWPNEGSDSFFDSPWSRGFLEYSSPAFVEETEIIGPVVLKLFASSTDSELLWSVRLFEIGIDYSEKAISSGWLRGTQREIDPSLSKPWSPHLTHQRKSMLEPGEVYEYQIPLTPVCEAFRVGSKIRLRLSSVDYAKTGTLAALASGHLKRQKPSRITLYHDDDHPSSILLPVSSGNVLGTYISEGKPYV